MTDRITDLGEARVIGPPGTGKSTFLIDQIAFDAERRGANAIVAVSHTNAAAEELAGRNTILPERNIGTLHSLAYRALDRPPLAYDATLVEEFNEQVGPSLQIDGDGRQNASEPHEYRRFGGNDLLQKYQRRRNARLPQTPRTQRFGAQWESFKENTGCVDFTDMIQRANEIVPHCPGRPEVLIADEVQDSSPLQMQLLWKWGAAADKVIFALDPDQAIFSFQGSDPRIFIDNPADRQKVLSQSYRVSKAVHAWALDWIRQNKNREPIEYKPTDETGEVAQLRASYETPEHILPAVKDAIRADESIMLLASCSYMLSPLIDRLRSEGIPFGNPYRRKERAWNPLAVDQEGSTLARIQNFFQGIGPGENWSHEQMKHWLEVTKNVVQYGKKTKLPELLNKEHQPVDGALLSEILTPDARNILTNPTLSISGASYWLRDHLLAGRRQVAEYILDVVEAHGREALTQEPNVIIGTVHSVKGGEADNVVLFPDLSQQGFQAWCSSDGAEETRRVFYVGATRARSRLLLANPASSNCVMWGAI